MNWTALFIAIRIVESSCNPQAFNESENAKGYYQIRPIYVEDVNRIAKTSYQHDDAYDQKKAEEMIRIYAEHYCKIRKIPLTYENVARLHNGGSKGHLKKATLPYWKKVKKELEHRKINL